MTQHEQIQQELNKLKQPEYLEDVQSYIDIKNIFPNSKQVEEKAIRLSPEKAEASLIVFLEKIFNEKIYKGEDLIAICRQFKLTIDSCEKFIGDISQNKAIEIANFVHKVRSQSLYKGNREKRFYNLRTDQMSIIAPENEFMKENKKIETPIINLKNNSIVLCPVCKFSPGTQDNVETGYYVIVSSWGNEELLVENEPNQMN